MRTIAAVTVGRSDFGIYLPILRAIQADPDLRLHLIATGAHLSSQFGMTVGEIEAAGFVVEDRVEITLSSGSPAAVGTAMGLAVLGLSQVYARRRPDILLVLGDRYEMHAAAAAAVPFKIPIAHIHGGEVTRGAIDDAFRHAMTKYSHLHFVSTDEHARRVVQMGEEPWRVVVSGAPALDNLAATDLMTRDEFYQLVGLPSGSPFVLVTYHPVTLQYEQADWQIGELLAALAESVLGARRWPVVITKPNADTNNPVILRAIEDFGREHSLVRIVDNLGTRAYFGAMRHAAALAGNSSSGIIEASSFELPVVNVGIRQDGRPAARNVIHVGNRREEIAAGIDRALSPEFRQGLRGLTNPYGRGEAARSIVETLKRVSLDDDLLLKRFCDLPTPSSEANAQVGTDTD